MKTVISFDFDGTIGDNPHIQKLATSLLKDPDNEIHIVTRRYEHTPENGDCESTYVYKVADLVGIKRENVHFTNRKYKYSKLNEIGAHMHYDDDMQDIIFIAQYCENCNAFLVQ